MTTMTDIQKMIKEYEYIESYFGSNIKYSKQIDEEFIIDNIAKNKPYTGYKSFLEWVNNKTKIELQKEYYIMNDKLEKNKITDISKKIIPSDEQQSIIDCISKGIHTVVDAVAGSGKTTTMIFIGRQNPDKNILQITYNKQLKLEVREKINYEKLDNLEIHTYHSLTVRFYDKNAHTDDAITKVLTKNIPSRIKKHYDILVIDEVQDMTSNYFTLICKFINDMKFKGTILVLGDRYQGVYEFKNADTRFLIYSNKIWNDNPKDFIMLPLQQSYRVTKQIATFVNEIMLGENRIISNKVGKHKIYYFKWNKFTAHCMFAEKIIKFIKMGYNPSDIFILSPSVKGTGNNPIKKLENELVKKGIPVYFARNEEDGIDEDIIKGKVVFTTFHQSKGRERKIVIVFGFDNTYFDFHAKDKDRTICPSELYVAITRASEILMVLEGDRDEPLPFLKKNYEFMQNCNYIDFIGKIPVKKSKDKNENPFKKIEDTHNTTVTELTKFIGEEHTNRLIPLVNKLYKIIHKPLPKYTVDIPLNVKMPSGLTEDVSDLNGLVIPAMYEAKIQQNDSDEKKLSTLEISINNMFTLSENDIKEFIKKKLQDLQKYLKKDPISAYLCMGNLYIALREKIYSKLTQIDKYDWLTNDMIKMCHNNLSSNVGANAKYEQELGNFENSEGKFHIHKTNMYGSIHIKGRVDAYDDTTLWEFKCVSIIQFEHLIQLIVYAWLWEKCMKDAYGIKKYKILNIKSREVRELMYESYIIDEIMSILFENKYYKKEKDTDIIFIEKCIKIRKSIENNDICLDNIIINDNTIVKKTPNLFNISNDSNTDTDSDSNTDSDDKDNYVSEGNLFLNCMKHEDKYKKLKSKITKK